MLHGSLRLRRADCVCASVPERIMRKWLNPVESDHVRWSSTDAGIIIMVITACFYIRLKGNIWIRSKIAFRDLSNPVLTFQQ